MTISSSLNASVAGLATNASRLATISDNIANSSTIGYKRIQTDFQSMVISAGSGSYSAGGVRATTQRMIDDSGSLVSTSNPTDLAVRGAGFLPVTSATQVQATNGDPQMRLTSTGSFRADSDGYLKTPSGMILMAWPANPDGSMPVVPRDTADGLVPVQINENQWIGSPTTEMLLGVNLPADETAAGSAGTAQSLSIEYFDNLGASESIDISFTPTVPATGASNEWTMVLRDSAAAGAVIGEYRLNFDDSRTSGGTLGSVTTVSGGAFDVTASSADALARIEAWFADPAGFATLAYHGATTDLQPLTIGEGRSLSYELRADDPVIRNTLRDLATAVLATDPALGLSATDQAATLRNAGEALLVAQDGLIGLSAGLGVSQEQIELAMVRQQTERFALESARNSLISADPFETATELEAVQFQLESLYAITVRSSQLNLVNFLR